MKTKFICNVSNARLLRNRIDNGEGLKVEYVVERVFICQGESLYLSVSYL